MALYPDASGGAIGALLRQIQQDRQTTPTATPPNTEPGNPVRDLVQPALSQVESPESAHVFASRPELSPGQPGSAPDGASTVVPPSGVAAPGGVVAPVAPIVPAAAPGQPGFAPAGAPGENSSIAPSSSLAASPWRASPPSLASHVGVPLTSVLGTSAKPAPSVAKPPTPTPTPTPSRPVGSTARVGGISLGTGLSGAANIASKILPGLAEGASRLNPTAIAASLIPTQALNNLTNLFGITSRKVSKS
jgi:hypothetical protein